MEIQMVTNKSLVNALDNTMFFRNRFQLNLFKPLLSPPLFFNDNSIRGDLFLQAPRHSVSK